MQAFVIDPMQLACVLTRKLVPKYFSLPQSAHSVTSEAFAAVAGNSTTAQWYWKSNGRFFGSLDGLLHDLVNVLRLLRLLLLRNLTSEILRSFACRCQFGI